MSELTEAQVVTLFDEALALRKADPPKVAMRSCWNCNTAHERLKEAGDFLLWCFGCGHFYLRGHDLSALSEARCRCPDDAPEPVCEWCTGGARPNESDSKEHG